MANWIRQARWNTETVFRQMDGEEPIEPYHQINVFCEICKVHAYESSNDICFCLVCGMPVGGAPPSPRRPERPKPRSTKRDTSRSYKVKGARPAPTHKPPKPPRPSNPIFDASFRATVGWAPPTFSKLPSEVLAALKRLELPDLPTLDVLHRQRRTLAFQHHPDRGGDTRTLAEINAAADVVIDYLDS